MSTDPLAAELEQVRKRMAAAPRTTVAALASAADVPRLVAAVEAALALASCWEKSGLRTVAAMAPVHVERRACGAEMRAAISAALTREGPANDHPL